MSFEAWCLGGNFNFINKFTLKTTNYTNSTNLISIKSIREIRGQRLFRTDS